MPIEIPDHTEVFVDANIFVYHFSGPTEYTDSCTQFLQCIEEARLSGLTSVLVLAETLHRLMIIEAATKLHIESKQALRHVKAHPLDVKKLTEHLTIVDQIRAFGIKTLPLDIDDILHSSAIKKECGLLTNDAINLALMRRHHIKNIATNDPDFGQVADLVVWKPVPIASS
ncbi:MAG: type II toxin-antitoxin system VapC family toxin [candidate division NC10 bacterium]|nr:type II toxin-antitoxin system VapC family toxin [candidate division NC10 bacterium]